MAKREFIRITKKQAELLEQVSWMGCLWGMSLIDAKVQNGKSDLRIARKARKLIQTKLKK